MMEAEADKCSDKPRLTVNDRCSKVEEDLQS